MGCHGCSVERRQMGWMDGPGRWRVERWRADRGVVNRVPMECRGW